MVDLCLWGESEIGWSTDLTNGIFFCVCHFLGILVLILFVVAFAFALQCRNNDPVQKRDYELHHVRLLHTLAETAHHIEARRYAR